MADIMEAVNSILSDPSAMEQVKALGGMLGIGDSEGNKSATPVQTPQQTAASDTITSLLSSLGNNNNSTVKAVNAQQSIPNGNMPSPEILGMIMKFAPILSSMNEENDSTRLLHALKPFLSEKRQKRVEQSVKLLGIMKILPMVKEIGLF